MTPTPEEMALAERVTRQHAGLSYYGAVYDAALNAAMEVREKAAALCEKRAEDRFAEFGSTDPCTNDHYYSGEAGETYETLDEENAEIAAAIRNGEHLR